MFFILASVVLLLGETSHSVEKNCSFVGVGGISCGESHGLLEICNLFDCQEDIKSQLATCHHLSKSNFIELIAFLAGMFHLTENQFKKMTICLSYRHNLGRYGRPLRSCQYPIHSGPVSKCSGRDVFNVSLSEAVFTLYGKLIQLGSHKYCAFESANVTSLLTLWS